MPKKEDISSLVKDVKQSSAPNPVDHWRRANALYRIYLHYSNGAPVYFASRGSVCPKGWESFNNIMAKVSDSVGTIAGLCFSYRKTIVLAMVRAHNSKVYENYIGKVHFNNFSAIMSAPCGANDKLKALEICKDGYLSNKALGKLIGWRDKKDSRQRIRSATDENAPSENTPPRQPATLELSRELFERLCEEAIVKYGSLDPDEAEIVFKLKKQGNVIGNPVVVSVKNGNGENDDPLGVLE